MIVLVKKGLTYMVQHGPTSLSDAVDTMVDVNIKFLNEG